MQHRFLLVASMAALAGAVLVWLGSPDTTMEGALVPPPPALDSLSSRAAPLAPASSADPSDPPPAEARPEPEIAPPPKPDVVSYEPDRNVVQPASPTGLILAATARRTDLIACWDDYLEVGELIPSSFNVDITVEQDESGRQFVRARVPGLDDGELEHCLTEVFDDARFEPLDEPALRLVWRVPMP